jgi:hypothetical protein
LHNEEHCDVNSPNIQVIKSRMRWVGHKACSGGEGSAYRVVVEKPQGKTAFARSRHRWEGNIKMDLLRNRIGRHGLR